MKMSNFNRFAGLLIDSDDENESKKEQKSPAVGQKAAAKKRKNRKKKSHQKGNSQQHAEASPDKDNVWRDHDEQLVSEMFHSDLKQALELSKLEYEQKAQVSTQHETHNGNGDKNDEDKKVNTGTKKNKTMHLETFLQINGDSEKQPKSKNLKKTNNKDKSNPENFFDDVEKEAAAIKRQEEKILLFKKNLTKDKDKKLTYKELLDMCAMKDKHVEGLENCVDLWKFKYEKLKNKYDHLQAVVKKGELKESCKLVLEVEKLTNIQNELTEEVQELNINLEQEKSKSSKLKEELLRIQGKKEQKTSP